MPGAEAALAAVAAYEIVQGPTGLTLVLNGPWQPELRAVLGDADIRHLRLSAYRGFRDARLDFLAWLPELERLELIGITAPDLQPLYSLKRLNALTLNGRYGRLDLTAFPCLERLRISWSARNFRSLLQCRGLTTLALAGYSGADLTAFNELTRLRHLAMMDARIESLEGVSALPALADLQVDVAPRLTTLHGSGAAPALRALRLRLAPRLRDLGDMADAPQLAYLRLWDCPALADFGPLAAVATLRAVIIGGRVRLPAGALRPIQNRSDLLSLCTAHAAPGPAAAPCRPDEADALLRSIGAEPDVR